MVDTQRAELADTQRVDALVALMVERSFYYEEGNGLNIYVSKAEADPSIDPERIPSKWVEVQPPKGIEANENSKSYVAELGPGEALESGIGQNRFASDNIKLAVRDVRRLEKVAIALTALGPFQHMGAFNKNPKFTGFVTFLKVFMGNLDQAYSIFDADDFFFGDDETLKLVLFSVLPIIYGGIHLTAWAFDFPTSVERIIWRVCCIDIMATLVSIFAITFALWMFEKSMDKLICWVFGRWNVLDGAIWYNALYVMIFIYAVSRIFIVVESFISLRHVPIGVYATPAWIQMLPHL